MGIYTKKIEHNGTIVKEIIYHNKPTEKTIPKKASKTKRKWRSLKAWFYNKYMRLKGYEVYKHSIQTKTPIYRKRNFRENNVGCSIIEYKIEPLEHEHVWWRLEGNVKRDDEISKRKALRKLRERGGF